MTKKPYLYEDLTLPVKYIMCRKAHSRVSCVVINVVRANLRWVLKLSAPVGVNFSPARLLV